MTYAKNHYITRQFLQILQIKNPNTLVFSKWRFHLLTMNVFVFASRTIYSQITDKISFKLDFFESIWILCCKVCKKWTTCFL